MKILSYLLIVLAPALIIGYCWLFSWQELVRSAVTLLLAVALVTGGIGLYYTLEAGGDWDSNDPPD